MQKSENSVLSVLSNENVDENNKSTSKNTLVPQSTSLYSEYIKYKEYIKNIKYKEYIHIINNTKDLILLLLLDKPSNREDISKVLDEKYSTIKNAINRTNDQNSLVSLGYVEDKDGILHITNDGRNRIEGLLAEIEDKIKLENDLKTRERNKVQRLDFYEQNLIKHDGAKYVEVPLTNIRKLELEIAEQILENPEEEIQLMKKAFDDKDVEILLCDYTEGAFVPLWKLRSNHLNKLTSVHGLVRRQSPVFARVNILTIECPKCKTRSKWNALQQKLPKKLRCISNTSEGKICTFKGQFKIVNKNKLDVQHIQIEEFTHNSSKQSQASKLNVVLYGQLNTPFFVSRIKIGQPIRLTGIIKSRQIPKSLDEEFYLEATHLDSEEAVLDLKISAEDEEKIKSFSADPNLHKNLCSKFAPNILGRDNIKTGLFLASVSSYDGVLNGKRNIIHLLIVGDPGTAKSQLANQMHQLLPLSKKASGKETSSVGLTAVAVRDELTGLWVIQGGVFVMADGHHLFVEEADKMKQSDFDACNEPMETCEINVAKAGLSGKFPTRTSAIMIMNPKYNNKFIGGMPLVEQIKMPSATYSRFDLVLPLRDLTDQDEDIGNAILKGKPASKEDKTFLAKYIHYARMVKTKSLSPLAHKKLIAWYIEARRKYGGEIIGRTLESLTRISTSFAKLELSEIVEEIHVDYAIDLWEKVRIAQKVIEKEDGEEMKEHDDT